MGNILSSKSELLIAAHEVGVEIRELSKSEVRELRGRLVNIFAAACRYDELWDYASDGDAIYTDNPWDILRRIDWVGEVVLFLPPRDGGEFFGLKSLQVLADVLENSVSFEFVVIDLSCSFLIAYNHSRFLIGRGVAVNWVS